MHNSWALRFGGELRLLGGHLHLRLGLGYDATPLPLVTLGPLLPDAPRMEVSAGLGWHEHWFALDIGYMAVISSRRRRPAPTSAHTYDTNGHVLTVSATVRFGGVGRHVSHEEPHPDAEEPPPRRTW